MKNLRDRRVDIMEVDEMTEQYTAIATVWAFYRGMSGQESFNAGCNFSHENCYFIISKPTDIELSTRNKIRYNGKEYDIQGIDYFTDTDGQNIKIQASYRF